MSNANNTLENFRKKFVKEINTEIKKVKTKKFTKKNNKEYYRLLSIKLIESLNKLLDGFNKICKNKINNINNINNSPIISTFNTYLKLPEPIKLETGLSKSSLITVDNSFSSDKLSISKIDSINYKSSYKNINEISKGEYIHNILLQEQTQKFIRSSKNDLTKINSNKNNEIDNVAKKSFSVKTVKSELSKNLNFDMLKRRNIVKEISVNKKKQINKSCVRLTKLNQKNSLNQENKIINRLQTTGNQNNIKFKVNLDENNPSVIEKKSNSEIEYEFSNDNILAEINTFHRQTNKKLNEQSVDDIVKKNMEINKDKIKGIDLKNRNNNIFNKRCNVY